MRIHALFHVPFEGLGSIADWAKARGHPVSATRLYESEALPPADAFDWLVVMGGPMSVLDEREYPWLVAEKRLIGEAIAAGRTVIGICLGAQMIAAVSGARVRRNEYTEIGWFPVRTAGAAATARAVLQALPKSFDAFHWHGETFDLPAGATLLGGSAACRNQGFLLGDRTLALQFHLETTRQGAEQLIANARRELVPGPFIQTAESMLSDDGRFARVNALMGRVLDALAWGGAG